MVAMTVAIPRPVDFLICLTALEVTGRMKICEKWFVAALLLSGLPAGSNAKTSDGARAGTKLNLTLTQLTPPSSPINPITSILPFLPRLAPLLFRECFFA